MNLRNTFLLFFLLTYILGFSQGNPQINVMVSPQMMLPNELTDKRQGAGNQKDLSFYAYPYQGKKVDLRDFKSRTNLIYEPDFIEIVPPEIIELYDDVTVLIGLIDALGVTPDESALIIWLAGNYESNEVTFFLNRNLSRNFKWDNEVVALSANDKPYHVIIEPINKKIPKQDFWIKVPRQRKVKKVRIKDKKRIINGFSVAFQAGVGLSKLDYIYDNLDKGFPTWYNINSTEKGVGLSLTYHTRYVRFSLNGNYQNVFHYTSYLNIQYDLPKAVFNSQTGRTSYIDQVQIERNLDRHPVNQFQYSVAVGLRLFLSKSIEFLPILAVGQTAYFPGEYEGSRFEEDGKFKLNPTNFYELGGSFEFLTGKYQSFFLDMYYLRSNWNPEGYFEATPQENLEVNHRTWKFALGYRIGF